MLKKRKTKIDTKTEKVNVKTEKHGFIQYSTLLQREISFAISTAPKA